MLTKIVLFSYFFLVIEQFDLNLFRIYIHVFTNAGYQILDATFRAAKFVRKKRRVGKYGGLLQKIIFTKFGQQPFE